MFLDGDACEEDGSGGIRPCDAIHLRRAKGRESQPRGTERGTDGVQTKRHLSREPIRVAQPTVISC